MIRIRRSAAIPQTLSVDGQAARMTMEAGYLAGEREFTFDGKIYAAKDVKQALIAMQHHKCAFCEAKITHVQHGDVEHFRPKAGSKQATDDVMHRPGYYWLAYEWSNLLLSCQLCNQRHKRNLFPLDDPAQRAMSHLADIGQEQPVFIDPSSEDPQAFIAFHGADPTPVANSGRGRQTIDALGLARPELREQRLQKLELLQTFRRIMEVAQQQRLPSPELLVEIERTGEMLRNCTDDDAEYASMARALLAG